MDPVFIYAICLVTNDMIEPGFVKRSVTSAKIVLSKFHNSAYGRECGSSSHCTKLLERDAVLLCDL